MPIHSKEKKQKDSKMRLGVGASGPTGLYAAAREMHRCFIYWFYF